MKRSLLIGLMIICAVASDGAETTNHISVEELRKLRLPDVLLESVTPVIPEAQKRPNAAPHLEVKGVIGEHIRFELLLPDAWNAGVGVKPHHQEDHDNRRDEYHSQYR